jgi:hypothetical protein
LSKCRPHTFRSCRACRGLTGSMTANCICGESTPIRRPGEARWTGRPVKTDNVFSPCRHGCHGGVQLTCCHWSSEPSPRALTSKATLGLHPEGTVIIDPTVAGCNSCRIACRRSSEPPGGWATISDLQSRLHPTTTQGATEAAGCVVAEAVGRGGIGVGSGA